MNKKNCFVLLLIIFELINVISSEPLNCKCKFGANRQLETKIIGGHVANPNFIPWHVSLANKTGDHYCGGFIANRNYVITSGSCLLNRKANEIEIRVGLNKLNDSKKLVYKASELIIEPSFLKNHNQSSKGNIGLIKLKNPIEFIDGRVEIGCLNLNKTIKSEFDVLMSVGYGSVEPTWRYGNRTILRGFPSSTLRYAYFYEEFWCVNYFICMKPVRTGDSTCSFDDGGPMSRLRLHGRVDVEGVHSHLVGKTDENNKYLVNECSGRVIYARLSSFQSFIEQYLGKNYCTLET